MEGEIKISIKDFMELKGCNFLSLKNENNLLKIDMSNMKSVFYEKDNECKKLNKIIDDLELDNSRLKNENIFLESRNLLQRIFNIKK